MTRTLMHSTRIAVQIAIEDDTGNVAALIMALTALVNLLLGLGGFIQEIVFLACDIKDAIDYTSTLFTIVFKSVAWGFVGVRL